MRLKLGRPDLGRYADRFDVPAADGPLGATFLGVASLLLDDGETAILTDGFFSRPSLAKVALGKVAPDLARIDAVLARAGIDRLAAVLPVHSHFDHAMDSAVVADRTGAVLVGGESTAYVGRGHGLPEDRIRVATPGEPMSYGAFTLTLVESHHCPPDRFPGVITEPVVPPVKAGGVQVRRGLVDPGRARERRDRAAPGECGLRRRVARRAPCGRRLSRRRSARRAERGLHPHLLGRDRRGRRRAPRGADPLGRLLPAARPRAPGAALPRRRPRRHDAGARRARRRVRRHRPLPDRVAAREPLGPGRD